jgi:hypothetical protein
MKIAGIDVHKKVLMVVAVDAGSRKRNGGNEADSGSGEDLSA